MKDIVDKVSKFIDSNQLIDDRDLIVGCSGGSDSVALLILLTKTVRNRIHVVHVNHNLRGEDANRDELFVSALCDKLDLNFRSYSYNVSDFSISNKCSPEEAGRILRYQAFDDFARELYGEEYENKTLICLAHHKNDIAETMLMNLFRGSGIDGLVSPKMRNGRIIRPLLCLTKDEIVDYLESINQDYCIDQTNLEACCTRNSWRNEVLPSIREVAIKDPVEALNLSYELLSEDSECLADIANEAYDSIVRENSWSDELELQSLLGYRRAIRSRIIRKLWSNRFGDLIDFGSSHMNAIEKFLLSAPSSGTTIDLPFDRLCYCLDGNVGFCERKSFLGICKEFAIDRGFVVIDSECDCSAFDLIEKTTKLPSFDLNISCTIVENVSDLEYNNYSWFYPFAEDLSLADVRLRRVNCDDLFKRAGSSGSKSIGRLLQDNKVPRMVRDNIFGVFVRDNIAWIPGIGHSCGFVDEVSRDRCLEHFEDKYKCNYLRLTIWRD